MSEAISKAMEILTGGNRTARHTTYTDQEINEVIGILRSLRDKQEEKLKKVYACNIYINGKVFGCLSVDGQGHAEAMSKLSRIVKATNECAFPGDFRRVE